jgi:hypothetical protein
MLELPYVCMCVYVYGNSNFIYSAMHMQDVIL